MFVIKVSPPSGFLEKYGFIGMKKDNLKLWSVCENEEGSLVGVFVNLKSFMLFAPFFRLSKT